LKTFLIALIDWIKAGPPKKPLLFDHVNRLHVNLLIVPLPKQHSHIRSGSGSESKLILTLCLMGSDESRKKKVGEAGAKS